MGQMRNKEYKEKKGILQEFIVILQKFSLSKLNTFYKK